MISYIEDIKRNNKPLNQNKMTPKEKAKDLVDKMKLQMPTLIIPIKSDKAGQLSCDIDLKGSIKNAKQCAFIAVDELILNCYHLEMYYWEQVKHEINNI